MEFLPLELIQKITPNYLDRTKLRVVSKKFADILQEFVLIEDDEVVIMSNNEYIIFESSEWTFVMGKYNLYDSTFLSTAGNAKQCNSRCRSAGRHGDGKIFRFNFDLRIRLDKRYDNTTRLTIELFPYRTVYYNISVPLD